MPEGPAPVTPPASFAPVVLARPTPTPTPLVAPPTPAAASPSPTPDAPLLRPPELCPPGTADGAPCALERKLDDGRVEISLAGNGVGDLTVAFQLTGENLRVDGLESLVALVHGTPAVVARVGPQDVTLPWKYSYSFHGQAGDFRVQHDGSVYRLPYATGASYRVIQGWNGSFSHAGLYAIDWAMPEGTPVLAARAGEVVYIRSDVRAQGTDPARKDEYPVNAVFIRHGDGTLGAYFHLQYAGVDVLPGQRVAAGEALGRSGNTGYSSQPHLHFEVRAPLDDKQLRSFAVQFRTARGSEALLEGQAYTAVD